MTALSNRLTALADETGEAFAVYRQRNRDAIAAYIEAGRKLIEARKLAKHGEWAPFLERAGVPARTAQRMMKVAASGLKSDLVADLGGARAVEALPEAVVRALRQEALGTLAGLDKAMLEIWRTERELRALAKDDRDMIADAIAAGDTSPEAPRLALDAAEADLRIIEGGRA